MQVILSEHAINEALNFISVDSTQKCTTLDFIHMDFNMGVAFNMFMEVVISMGGNATITNCTDETGHSSLAHSHIDRTMISEFRYKLCVIINDTLSAEFVQGNTI